MPYPIELKFPYTFRDRYFAEFQMIFESKLKMIIHSVFPLIGVGLLVFALQSNKTFPTSFWLAIIVAFLFLPGILLVVLGTNFLTNKAMREPFTYLFDEKGVHVHAASYEYIHKWPAFTKVKPTKRYLLFFLGPGSAHCIPMRAVEAEGVLSSLLELAKSQGVAVIAR